MLTLRIGRRTWVPSVLGAALALVMLPGVAHAIPAWARKYNVNCTQCHFPVPPVLNSDGLRFKWAGYRMPDEIGKSMEATKIGDYLATHGMFLYTWTKTSGQPSDSSSVSVPSASLFAAGSLGKFFGAFLEIEAAPDGIGVAASAQGTWGQENSFGAVRVVQGHLISEGAAAGFDRPIGILTPLPIDGTIGSAIPFGFGDHNGVDVSWVFDQTDRLAVGVANSTDPVFGGGTPRQRVDAFVSNQFLWDELGGGLDITGYYGNAQAVDSLFLDANSSFYRVGISASHYFGMFEAIGGYVYGKDMGLPVGDMFTASSATGQAYWLGAQYTIKKEYLTFYGRWEFVDPNKSVADDGLTRWVFGGAAPLMTPQYLFVNLEYFHDQPQLTGTPSRQGLYVALQMAY
jgi:hypothetical protein